MICPQCGFMMDAFDRECPRCHGKGTPPPAQQRGTTPGPQSPPVMQPSGPPQPQWQSPQWQQSPAQPTVVLTPAAVNVNNTTVWILAFVPLLALFFQGMLAAMMNLPVADFWWVALAMNITLCVIDERQLKSVGCDTQGMGVWAVLFVPAYLFMRAARLKQSNAYAIVWLVTFVLSLGAFAPSQNPQSSPAGSGGSPSGSLSGRSTPDGDSNPESSSGASTAASTSGSCSGDLCVENLGDRADSFMHYVTGTVVNNGGQNYSYVQVEINLYDASGSQVGSTLANVNNLEPHGRWNFEAAVTEEKATSYKLKNITAY